MKIFREFVFAFKSLAEALIDISREMRKMRQLAEARFEKADRDKEELKKTMENLMKGQQDGKQR